MPRVRNEGAGHGHIRDSMAQLSGGNEYKKVNLQQQSWPVQIWSYVSGSSAERQESFCQDVLALCSGRQRGSHLARSVKTPEPCSRA